MLVVNFQDRGIDVPDFLKNAILYCDKIFVRFFVYCKSYKRVEYFPPNLFKRGFVLLDVFLALLLVAVAVLPLTAMFYYSRLHISAARNINEAVMLAQSGMEEFLDLSYNSLISQAKTSVPDRPGFFRSVTVSDSPDGRLLKTIVVTVYYPEGGGERQVSLATRRAAP